MQLKNYSDMHFICTRVVTMKMADNQTISRFCEEVRKSEVWYVADSIIKWCTHFGKMVW